jgi:aldehyde:ferredoxin oxidoreductase
LVPNDTLAWIAKANACYSMLVDGAGGCYYAEMMGVHMWRLIDYLNAANGWDYDGDHYMQIGERIQTLRQLFNIKHGVAPKSFVLPDRMAGKPPLTNGPLKGVQLRNTEQVSLYWKTFGWDAETGIPTEESLKNLQIPQLLEVE